MQRGAKKQLAQEQEPQVSASVVGRGVKKYSLPFDLEYAEWLKERFPKKVNKDTIYNWRKNNTMPDWAYQHYPVEIFEIPLNLYLWHLGWSLRDLAEKIGVKDTYLNSVANGRYTLTGDVRKKLEKVLEPHKNLTIKKLPKVVTIQRVWFIEMEDEIHLRAVHTALFKNEGHAYECKSFYLDGLIVKDGSMIKGKTLSECGRNFKVSTKKEAYKKFKIATPQIAKHIKFI